MSTPGERLKALRKQLGLTQKEMGKRMGLAWYQIKDMETGKVEISPLIAKILYHEFHANPDWIEKEEGEMFEKPPIPEALPLVTVPVLGRVPAGFPDQIPQQEIIEYISLPDIPKGSYGLIVKGDSMAPKIKDGDYALFVPNGEFKNGDVVVVNNEWGESMVKRYREKDGEVMLTSDNPEYPSFKPNEHYRVMGKVVGVWRRIKL